MSGASLATLNDRRVLTCSASLPAYGVWWADVECEGSDDAALAGPVTLAIDDLTLKGTIVNGGPYDTTRARYRICGGAGGWARQIAAKGYANDLGVKLVTVLRDAAASCGETLGPIDPSATIGPSFVRANAPAIDVPNKLLPRAWYVDESGVTQVGRRPSRTFVGNATRFVGDASRGKYDLAPGEGVVSTLVPGAVVDGVEAVDVEHVIGDDGALRTVIWGRQAARAGDPFAESLRGFVEDLTASHRFFAPWEYRVVTRNGDRLDLQATRVSSGMPDLRNVRIRPGVAGVRVWPKLGSLVEVAFLNGDPSQPRVVGFDDQDAPGVVADQIALQAGTTGVQATEHATSAEALVNFVFQVLTPLATPLGGPTAVSGAITTALGLMGSSSISPFAAAITAALAAKVANASGNTPGLGWPFVKGG